MDLCNQSCLSGEPASPLHIIYVKAFEPNSFIPVIHIGTLISTIYTTFNDLHLGSSRKIRKQNLLSSFFAHFSTGRDKIWCGDETVKAEHPDTTFE